MAKILTQMTPELIKSLYGVLGLALPQDRMLNQIVIVLEAGKPVSVTERGFPVTEATDAIPPSAADALTINGH